MKYEIFFLKHHAEKEAQRLVTDPFIKSQTGAYLSIGSRKIAPSIRVPDPDWGGNFPRGQFSGHPFNQQYEML